MKKNRLHPVKINLLPEKSLDVKEKLLFFALHYLRYVIVLTQITVIIVFFYRFQIDQAIIDLREDVSQKQEILKITTPLITEAQTTEKRLTQIKTILRKESAFTTNFDFILSKFPENITLNDLSIGEKEVSIKGQSVSISRIQALYQGLLRGDSLKSITINDISKSAETGLFQFAISATL